jgi:hypothetical protein
MKRLVDANVQVLEQMCSTFQKLDDVLWSRPTAGSSGLRIGAHVRHVLDFYSCLFAGLERGEIDYDARSRDRAIESSRPAAMRALQSVIDNLLALIPIDPEIAMDVRDEGTILRSTIGREMNSLLNHTIHHMALIAVALHSFGGPVEPDFGVAPATLRYHQRTGAAA